MKKKKTNGMKNKSGIISRQRLSQERGPYPPLYPEHPSALASRPLNQSHCLVLKANTGSIVILQGRSPTRSAFHPPRASSGLSRWAGTQAVSQKGLYPGWCLRICADLLQKSCQVNPFAIPWEMSSQGQSSGVSCVNWGVWVRKDGGQNFLSLYICLQQYLSGPQSAWKVLEKI
jgi:hypothetical protein